MSCLVDSVCLACYVANGHLITFSLPSLRPLLDVDYLPQADLRSVYNGHTYHVNTTNIIHTGVVQWCTFVMLFEWPVKRNILLQFSTFVLFLFLFPKFRALGKIIVYWYNDGNKTGIFQAAPHQPRLIEFLSLTNVL